MFDLDIAQRAQRSIDAEIKCGRAAVDCMYQYVHVDLSMQKRRGRTLDFTELVARSCAARLGGSKAPRIEWYRSAEVGETPLFGCPDAEVNGLAQAGVAWLREDIDPGELIGVIAHEVCHAIKHRDGPGSLENEIEANEFERRVSQEFGFTDAYADLLVVDRFGRLPQREFPTSKAITRDDMKVYTQAGSYSRSRWEPVTDLGDLAPAFKSNSLDTASGLNRSVDRNLVTRRMSQAEFDAEIYRLLTEPINLPWLLRNNAGKRTGDVSATTAKSSGRGVTGRKRMQILSMR